MRCKSIRYDLADYASGRLGPERRKTVEEHLAVCPACRDILREISPVFRILHEHPPIDGPMPGAEFVVRVRERIDTQNAGRRAPTALLANPLVRFVAPLAIAGILLYVFLVPRTPDAEVSPALDHALIGSLFEHMDTAQIDRVHEELPLVIPAAHADAWESALADAKTVADIDTLLPLFNDLSPGELIAAGSVYVNAEDLYDLVEAGDVPPLDASPR
ncbi:MAG: zf-HC2 domain-containing protein [Bacteroidota bacterium]|nr:zf-HC2 domain-containing protein [Bacteroidota bacterium]